MSHPIVLVADGVSDGPQPTASAFHYEYNGRIGVRYEVDGEISNRVAILRAAQANIKTLRAIGFEVVESIDLERWIARLEDACNSSSAG